MFITSKRTQDLYIVTNTISSVLHGDLDRNEVVNFFDISPFIVLLTQGTFQAEGDCNLDGVVDFFDISPFIQVLSGN